MAQEDGPNSHGAPTRSPAGGWLPHGGLNGTAQTPANPDTTCEYSTDSWPRHANPTSGGTDENRAQSGPSNTSAPRQATPSLRFLPFVEQSPRAHPPLVFNPIYRTLPNNDHVIRIGRYSERDNTADQNSAAAQKGGSVGFKSKVVSRRHCEMFQSGGQWFIKDVKSSSGTFLNHVRLSAPNFESRPFPVQDGDKVQLGIDFRGGEEMIFRCVKIRLEINRGWQRSLNNFNTAAHKRLQDYRKRQHQPSDASSAHSTECSICLNAVAPCQTLFVAPCSHTWHYKCIKPMIDESYPNFLCPNCRGLADLEADVDEPFAEEWQEDEDEGAQQDKSSLREPGEGVVYPTVPQATRPCAPPAQPAEHDPEPSSRIERRPIPPAAAIPPATRTPITPTTTNSPITAAVEARNRINMTNGAPRTIRNRRLSSIDQLPTALGELTIQDPSLTRSSAPATQSPAPRPGPSGAAPTPPSTTTPILAPTPTLPPPSRTPRTATGTLDTPTTAIPRNADQLGPDEQALQDLAVGGPKTPRNDAGPFVLDGSAGRTGGGRGLDELVIEGMGGGGGRNGE